MGHALCLQSLSGYLLMSQFQRSFDSITVTKMQFIYINMSILTIRRLVIPVSPVSNTLQAPPTIYALNFATFRSMADLTLLYVVLILEGNKNHVMLVPVRLPRSVWQLCQLLSSAEHLLSPVSLIHSSFAHVQALMDYGANAED